MKNLTNLLLVLAVIFIILGCGRRSITSAKKDCVSTDGSQIVLTDMYGGVTIVDYKTGNILTKKESEKNNRETDFGVAVCTQNNEIFSVYPNLLVNLKNNQRINHRIKGSTVLEKLDQETLLTFSGGILTTDSDGDYRDGDPLQIYVEKLGQETRELKPITLSLDKFEGVRNKAFKYWIKPIRLIDKENLLIVAGATPEWFKHTREETSVFPEPWGFYIFNLKTEQVKILGTTKKADVDVNFYGSPKVASTRDGRLISLMTFVENDNVFAVYDTKKDQELFRKSVSGREISNVTFSSDETKIATLVKASGTAQNSEIRYSINFYDSKTGALIKEIILNFGVSAILDFRQDEVILSNSKKVSKINADTGSQIWETTYFDK